MIHRLGNVANLYIPGWFRVGDVFFFFFLYLIFAGLFGWAGSAIAQHKGGDGFVGALLGFFLGPIGLVIAVLLGPSVEGSGQTQSSLGADGPPPSRDLDDARYKVWLIETYKIARNDVLGQFVCGSRTFETVDDALKFANSQEAEKQEKREAVLRQQENALEKQREQQIEEQNARDQRFLGPVEWSMVILALAAITFLLTQAL